MSDAFERRLEQLKGAIGAVMVGVRELRALVPPAERDTFTAGESQVHLLLMGANGSLEACANHVQSFIYSMESGAQIVDRQLQEQKESHDNGIQQVAEGKDGGSQQDL